MKCFTRNITYKPQALNVHGVHKRSENVRIFTFTFVYGKTNLGLQVRSEIVVSIRSGIKVYALFIHRARVLLFQHTSK